MCLCLCLETTPCDCLKGTTTQAQPHENGLRKATVGCLISSPAMQQDPVTWEADTARSVNGLLSEGELVPVTLQPSCLGDSFQASRAWWQGSNARRAAPGLQLHQSAWNILHFMKKWGKNIAQRWAISLVYPYRLLLKKLVNMTGVPISKFCHRTYCNKIFNTPKLSKPTFYSYILFKLLFV